MTPEQLNEYVELNNRKIDALEKYWKHALPTVEAPSREQFFLWLKMFDYAFDTVLFGVDETVGKCQRLGGKMSPDHAVRFCSACAIRFHKTGTRLNIPADKFVERESVAA
jgi:hypothetical protein